MISVVICTRNRAPQLERCLRQMSEVHKGSDLALQVVIVDNDSEDRTRAVIEAFAPYLPLKYALERKRGLSHARNRGIAEAEYPIIAFTDDDCLVTRDWARAIVAEFEKRPELSILGGKAEPGDPGDYPLAHRTHDRMEHIATIGQIVKVMIGCNMAYRRGVFDTVGLFDPAFGKGTRIGSAEDVDLLYRALKRGSTIAYFPHVVVVHAHGRNTPAAVESAIQDYVKGRGAFYWKFLGDRVIMKMAYWEVRSLLKAWLRIPAASQTPRLLRSLALGALYKLADGMVNGTARFRRRLNG